MAHNILWFVNLLRTKQSDHFRYACQKQRSACWTKSSAQRDEGERRGWVLCVKIWWISHMPRGRLTFRCRLPPRVTIGPVAYSDYANVTKHWVRGVEPHVEGARNYERFLDSRTDFMLSRYHMWWAHRNTHLLSTSHSDSLLFICWRTIKRFEWASCVNAFCYRIIFHQRTIFQ